MPHPNPPPKLQAEPRVEEEHATERAQGDEQTGIRGLGIQSFRV